MKETAALSASQRPSRRAELTMPVVAQQNPAHKVVFMFAGKVISEIHLETREHFSLTC
jgi:hypothetical protein